MERVELKNIEMMEKETIESHVFEIEFLCVSAGYIGQEDEQPTRFFRMKEEDESVSQRDTEEEKTQSIVEKDEKGFSTKEIRSLILNHGPSIDFIASYIYIILRIILYYHLLFFQQYL